MVMDQHPLTSFKMCCLFVLSFVVILITDGSQIFSVAKASLRHGLFLPSGSRGLASQVFALLSSLLKNYFSGSPHVVTNSR